MAYLRLFKIILDSLGHMEPLKTYFVADEFRFIYELMAPSVHLHKFTAQQLCGSFGWQLWGRDSSCADIIFLHASYIIYNTCRTMHGQTKELAGRQIIIDIIM
jgi:hypothetical protein